MGLTAGNGQNYKDDGGQKLGNLEDWDGTADLALAIGKCHYRLTANIEVELVMTSSGELSENQSCHAC